jgi:hypothetical protein
MSETVYIETSILGYLTARSTKNLILAANMEITKDWWEFRRNAFTLYTSEAVLDEVTRGDPEIAAQRLEILRGFPLLALNQAVQSLAVSRFGYKVRATLNNLNNPKSLRLGQFGRKACVCVPRFN